MAISIGSDPELMLLNRDTGAVVAACGLIGGTKGAAMPMLGLPDGYGVQEDNVMVEFNIPPVATSRSFAQSIRTGVEWICEHIENNHPHLEIDVGHPTRVLLNDQLVSKQAQEFGCSPDFEGHENGAKSSGVSPSTLLVEGGAYRFNGGHVHVGYKSCAPEFIAAQFADVFLGLPSIGLDVQGKRRELYGQAGRYRPVPYGIEYRTLSNFWLWDYDTCRDVGRRALALAEFLEGDEPTIRKAYGAIPWVDVRRAINEENAEMASELLSFVENNVGMEV